MSQPPPPRIAPPGTLSEAEVDLLPATSVGQLTPAALERIIGERPVDLTLYRQAFTHTDAAMSYGDYERFEFLGDAILGFVCARYLITKFPNESEGFLTVMRTRLTRSESLYAFAKILGLEQFVIMSGKAIYTGQHRSKKVLEDVFESLVCAIYMDLGLLSAKTFIHMVFDTMTDWHEMSKDRNFKDQLMRLCHKLHVPLPIYVCKRNEMERTFTVTVSLEGHVGSGTHHTKKQAEQLAAKQVLLSFGAPVDD
jgi:ribonuclease-3